MARQIDSSVLQMALVGYEQELQKIDQKIAELRRMIGGGKAPAQMGAGPAVKAKRVLSAAARKRIAAAQRKRWAAFHKQAAAPKTAPSKAKPAPKRKLSPAARARIIANLAKARAAKAAKRTAA